jgi:hypothetical protein
LARGDYKLPFSQNYLNQVQLDHYPSYDAEWHDNDVFHATMSIEEGVTSGRSAKYLHLKDVITGVRYPIFVADFLDLALNSLIDHGVVSGRWVGQKRGKNYGIRRAKADES